MTNVRLVIAAALCLSFLPVARVASADPPPAAAGSAAPAPAAAPPSTGKKKPAPHPTHTKPAKPAPATKEAAPKHTPEAAPATSEGAKPHPGPSSAHEVVEHESRIEFDERMVRGQSAAGAIFLFQRTPSDLKSIVEVPDSFRPKTVELLQTRGTP